MWITYPWSLKKITNLTNSNPRRNPQNFSLLHLFLTKQHWALCCNPDEWLSSVSFQHRNVRLVPIWPGMWLSQVNRNAGTQLPLPPSSDASILFICLHPSDRFSQPAWKSQPPWIPSLRHRLYPSAIGSLSSAASTVLSLECKVLRGSRPWAVPSGCHLRMLRMCFSGR